VRTTIAIALIIFFDVVMSGTPNCAIMFCPIWILVSLVRSAICRPGWRTAILRVAPPLVTLGLVLANSAFQQTVMDKNAARIIAACEEYHEVNGKYPETLDDLVPHFLPSVPVAKYCLVGEFRYFGPQDGFPRLMMPLPSFGRIGYDFGQQKWLWRR
jgi:hypothetical protein